MLKRPMYCTRQRLSSPSPRPCGERVGVRGLSASPNRGEGPLIPTFSPRAGRRSSGGAVTLDPHDRFLKRALAATFIALLAAAPSPTLAQDSAKPIRVIVATGVGGTADVFMRVLGDEYHKRYGRPFVVENRTGGGMNIGGRACAEAPNDGSTICNLPNTTLTYNRFLYKRLPYDPDRFEPITNPFFNTQLLVASAALGVHSLDELAALSKARPGTLSYTVPSEPLSVFMDWWRARSGADLVRIPFKGGGDAVNGMMSGATPVAFLGIGNWLPHVAVGTVRPLAVDGEQRSPLTPDVPTIRELGYGGDMTRTYFGIVAPPGTPRAIITRLYQEIAAIGRDPEFRRKRLVDVGLEPVFDTPDEFGRYLKEDSVRAERIAKAAGLVPQ
jgi:tripartite-type tricarboxylate transporter receptor subunit TctC